MTLGNLGHFFVILAFVSAVVAAFAYLRATLNHQLPQQPNDWKLFGKAAFYVHAGAIFGVVIVLYSIIYGNYYQYHYAWDHASRALPWYYRLSCFWEGQEGSFLLWMFWHAVLGIILIKTNRANNPITSPLMAIFIAVQAFLTSMILGVVIPGIDLKIGSSPFLTMAEAMPDAPFLQLNPNFIPEDGTGLNPLLQNYWMVIHPPTLFLGFALTLVPYAYLMASLWRNQITDWLRPTLPWALVTGVVLGVGILMGGYWAYETLSFNSYWSWDPVENAVYVPWLVLVAGLHVMLLAKKNATALKTSIILIIAQFLLILYSTFLTRSGILGDSSVHSFTDLGLSGQLLTYLLFFVAISIFIAIRAWRQIPADKEDLSPYSIEFWLFIGAVVLCLASFQVILPTSIPVWNSIMEAFGIKSNLAPPTNSVSYYTKFQLWFFVVISILTGIGQYFWWKRVKKGQLQELLTPVVITLFVSAAIIGIAGVKEIPYIVLLTASVFGLVANATIVLNIIKGNYRLSGGAVTHIGVALMLIGILWSSGYQKIISLNNTGMMISNDETFTKDNNKENKENLLLWLGKPTQMGTTTLTYKGPRTEIRDVPEYVPSADVDILENDFRAVCLKDIQLENRVYHKKGDTVEVYPENVYYEVEYKDEDGKISTLFPRMQVNKQMGTVVSPSIKHEIGRDLYSFVTVGDNPNDADEWGDVEHIQVTPQDTFIVNDYVAILDGVSRTDKIDGITLGPNDIAVKAQIRILDRDREYFITPTYAINEERMVMRKPEVNNELGLRIQFMEIDPKQGLFKFDVTAKQRDYIVLKAVEKPLVNLLWIGTLVLVVGFSMAAARRFREFLKMQAKEA